MTQEEKNEIVTLADQAMRVGDMEKAIILAKQMPLSPEVAEAVKFAYGAEYLKNSGFDFSEAEEKYGKDWLSS